MQRADWVKSKPARRASHDEKCMYVLVQLSAVLKRMTVAARGVGVRS